MDLKKEQEYIENFFEELTDKEFMQMLDECGNNLILPTKQIYSELVMEGFYDQYSKYNKKSSYHMTEQMVKCEKYEEKYLRFEQGVAA